MSIREKKWYVVYTKPRWEKKVYDRLTERGIEAYCPLNRTRKKWSDRVKWVEEPLFKSYVFVLVAEEDQTLVRMVNGVVNFVYWLGKPAVVKRGEIEIIRKFLHDFRDVKAVLYNLQENTQVTILQGAFMDKKGVVRKIINNKVQVIIGCIGYSLVAVVDKSNLMIVEK